MIKTAIKKNSGSILIYVILVISLISAIALTVSVIIINELRLTTVAADAAMAYYAAESGLERGLYGVKILRESGSTLTEALNIIQNYFDDAGFLNNTAYTDQGSSTQPTDISHQEIKENQYVQADYYNVDSPLAPSVVESITVQNGTQASNPDTASWAEVSWIAWDQNGTLGESTSARKVIGPTDLQPDEIQTEGWPINLNTFGTDFTPSGYRVRIKALFGDLSNFTITPHEGINGGGDVVTDLPSQIVIKSVGERDKFKQALTAILPWRLPLFGLYDYVLFSEGEIAKTTILSSPIYSSGVIETNANFTGNWCTGCDSCRSQGWLGLECSLQPPGNGGHCSGSSIVPWGAVCKLNTSENDWGFTLPIPDFVPQGDEYYVSVRGTYVYCDEVDKGTGSYCGREIAVEINGQSAVVGDQEPSNNIVKHTCTIPEPFSLGDPSLPEEDPSRTIQFSVHPYGFSGTPGADPGGWHPDEYFLVGWYQLSTYKIFPDCP